LLLVACVRYYLSMQISIRHLPVSNFHYPTVHLLSVKRAYTECLQAWLVVGFKYIINVDNE